MADTTSRSRTPRSGRLPLALRASAAALAVLAAAGEAHAQERVVGACTGVSLPRSVVTDILSPVVTGITGPTETTVNGLLGLPLVGGLLGPLSLNATGLLAQAAAGDPVTLQVLDVDGVVVGPTDACRATSDSISLDAPAGIAIGGNRINGLGAEGVPAFAADVDAIAFGNNARAAAGATGSVALGTDAAVTAANSVALGAGSVATRGALAGYTAAGLAGPQASAGEVSVGAPGALRQITNVAAGTAATDAATVGQVSGVLDQVAALAANTVQYTGPARDRVTLGGATGTAIDNLAPGLVSAGSTEAVNGAQLFATNAQVAANTTAITNVTNLLTGSTVSPVQYSNPATPTTPNGGTLTNDVTLVGADPAAPVALHNVAGGAVTATSTDAVNGQQLFAVANQAANGVQYDRDAAGARTNTVTLAGGNPAAAVTLANVAAGTLAPGSTQAVNGAQLYATDQVARAGAAQAANSVQYDAGGTSVTLGGPGGAGAALTVRNVAAGTAATDAVNLGQLQGAIGQANGYTDARIAALDFDVTNVRRDLRREVGAGTSAALAAAGLPQANEPGRSMIAVGGGTYRGQSAIALGASTFLDDGHTVLRLGATYDSRGYAGANAGFGYQF